MYTVVWQYDVTADNARAFEAFYGPAGRWVELFRASEGFIETLLLREVAAPDADADTTAPRRYVTLDRWVSADAYARFQGDRRAEYEALDAAAGALTSAERRVGAFES